MSVMSRPADAAPVTILPSMTQFTAQLVCPVTTTSISSSIRSTIGGNAPETFAQRLIVSGEPAPLAALLVDPPSWSRTTIVSAPRRFSSGTSALTVSASSKKSTCEIPAGLTIEGVPSRVMPTTAILGPPLKRWIL